MFKSFASASEIQSQRQKRVRDVCTKILGLEPIDIEKDNPRFLNQYLLKDWLRLTYFVDEYKSAYFLVQKAGFTNWLEFLTSIQKTGKAELRVGDGVPFSMKDTEFRAKLKNYKKIIFVRNPFSRIVSAYNDKFVILGSEYYRGVSRAIIQEVRGIAIPKSQKPDLGFSEFIQFILTSEKYYDAHWLPIYDQKIPCDVYYDFIGKIETIQSDVKYMKSLYNISQSAVYINSYIDHEDRVARMIKYYGEISPTLIENIAMKYRNDFLVFGYPLPDNFNNFKEYVRNMKADEDY